MTEYTAHFRVPIPDFEQEPWHDELETALRALDEAIYTALLTDAPNWANDTAYQIGDIVIDAADGLLYTCAVAHTSPSSPTTFATFRAANPTYWNPVVTIPQFRGTWLTATSYIKGDFVIDTNRYAVCNVSHVSTVFNTDLGAGKWTVLVDLSGIDQGINNQAEQSVASAATVDIGALTQTRLLITGNVTITSFGAGTNKYKILRYQSTPVVTHNAAALILLGGANRTMRAGDIQILTSDASGNWRELAFARADGNPATEAERGVIELATSAETETGTDDVRALTALKVRQKYLPGLAGTKALFVQTTAPIGWTKDVDQNDKALRIVSGAASTGGSSAFSTVFGKTATDATTLSTAQIPSHNHGGITGDDSPDHTHTVPADNTSTMQGGVASAFTKNAGTTTTSGRSTVHQHSIASEGGGGSHTHPMDIRVQYVDVIKATKD